MIRDPKHITTEHVKKRLKQSEEYIQDLILIEKLREQGINNFQDVFMDNILRKNYLTDYSAISWEIIQIKNKKQEESNEPIKTRYVKRKLEEKKKYISDLISLEKMVELPPRTYASYAGGMTLIHKMNMYPEDFEAILKELGGFRTRE